MNTGLAGTTALIYLTVASVIAYALGRYWWPTLRSEDPHTDRITRTHPLGIAFILATVAIAWPITIPLGIALHSHSKNGDPS